MTMCQGPTTTDSFPFNKISWVFDHELNGVELAVSFHFVQDLSPLSTMTATGKTDQLSGLKYAEGSHDCCLRYP